MTINEAIGSLIATLTFWHIIAFIAIVVVLLIVYVRVANVKSWHFKSGFEYYPDEDAKVEVDKEKGE